MPFPELNQRHPSLLVLKEAREPHTCLMSGNLCPLSTNDTLGNICMHAPVCAYVHTQRFVVGSRTHIGKITFFGPKAFDASPYCHYGTQTRTIITPLLLLSMYSR